MPKVFGLCATTTGTKIDESLEKMDTKEYGKMLKRILILEAGRVPAKNAGGLQTEGQKRRVTKKECKKLREERFGGAERIMKIANKRMLEDR